MSYLGGVKRFVIIVVISSLLFGCATYQGDGVVIKKELYSVAHKKSTQAIQDRTRDGALLGATSGAIAAGGIGALAGLISASGGVDLATVATAVFVSALGGGVVCGGIGLAVGGGVGLMQYGLTSSKKEVWQYDVKSLKDSKILRVTQQTRAIPVNSKVKIMEQHGSLFIKLK